jgi:hypothetical protein
MVGELFRDSTRSGTWVKFDLPFLIDACLVPVKAQGSVHVATCVLNPT